MNKIKSLMGVMAVFFLVGCGGKYDQTVEIATMGNQMKYNMVQINAKPGSTLLIKFENLATIPVMKHNIVVLNSSSAIDEVGKAALNAPNYLPDHPSILAASDMVDPGNRTELVVNIPNKPGEYPFICTYPGHYQMMQGKIIVK